MEKEAAALSRRARRRPGALAGGNVLLFLAVIGPGIITANVDNDAGGIATYSIAGAHFGYSLLWTLLPITLALIVVQEMSARHRRDHGQGPRRAHPRELRPEDDVLPAGRPARDGHRQHGRGVRGLGRERCEIFGVPRWVSVPIGAFVVWWLVVKGNYKIGREDLPHRLLRLPHLHRVGALRETRLDGRPQADVPSPHRVRRAGYLMIIGIVGTTIAPWMQFYLQSSIVEKRIGPEEY